ncbi:MAG: hypoxanthine phosphoribosyltransferase [Dehalococcoidia bacterium]|nr:hypoxanthine phosphoribosyltransferase [Dehalococcoidia bacterium]MDZ4247226.1 hypoxanthine phosphoribosyltransferase [Dehalococcoidia bacterium]
MNQDSPELKVLIAREEIAQAVQRIAGEVKKDLLGTNPVVIGILKGSIFFLADLIHALEMPLQVELVSLSSYGSSTETSGQVKMKMGISGSITGRAVLVVEDIIDTGITVNYLMKYLRRKNPRLLKLCCLLDKPERRKVAVTVDYVGFTIPDKFVVGYGMDWDEKYRYLRDIYFIGD